MAVNEFEVRPSQRPEVWLAARRDNDIAARKRLLDQEPPGVVAYESHVYLGAQHDVVRGNREAWPGFRDSVLKEMEIMTALRSRLAWRQRELDLAMLRFLRKRGELSVVLGAGASVAAGGPSWPELVGGLIKIALADEHEVAEILPPAAPGGQPRYRKRRVPVPPLSRAQRTDLEQVGQQIHAGQADTEALKRATQTCVDLFGQRAFTHVTTLVYAGGDVPGPVHRAVARLGSLPDDPGWRAIISYNFDSLAADALLERGVGVDNCVMMGDEVMSRRVTPDQWPGAPQVAPDQLRIVPVYYLHGFTPSYSADISHIRFVFSTAQYDELYEPEKITIVGHVLSEYLSSPRTTGLFVGCSFDDEVMNGLVHRAGHRRYGLSHYAFIRWTGGPVDKITHQQMNLAGERYLQVGVRPVWFHGFEEIPGMLQQLE